MKKKKLFKNLLYLKVNSKPRQFMKKFILIPALQCLRNNMKNKQNL